MDDDRPVDDSLVDALMETTRVLVGVAIRSVGAAGTDLTMTQYRVLVLAEDEPIGIGDIAEQLGVNPSNASRLCDRLERLGLLARRRSLADRRAVLVEVTEEGHALLDEVSRHRRAEIADVVGHLDARSAERLAEGLRVLNESPADEEAPSSRMVW